MLTLELTSHGWAAWVEGCEFDVVDSCPLRACWRALKLAQGKKVDDGE